MWPFKKTEKRENQQPHKEIDTSACSEVNQGIGLLQKLLNLKEYGALHQSAFFSALSLISNSIAMMSWEFKSYNEDDEPDSRFLKDLFANSQLTQFIMIKNMIKDCIIYGNGFCYIERDNSGKPRSLKYLPYGECNIIYNKITDTLFYQVPRFKKTLVEPCNILHIRMISNDGVNGLPIMNFANSTIKLSAASEKAASDFFSSGMTVQGILSTDTPRLTKEQREAIRSAWNESQVGAGSGLAVLEAGMSYTPVSSNSKEAQLLESRVYSVQEIARFFNISPVLLGDLSKSSYNSIEQAMLQFVLNTLSPYITMLEQEINLKLIMPKDRYKYYIDICEEDIIRSDKTSQANYLNTLVQGGILSRNEARKKLGYPAVDGGDNLTVSYTDISQNTIGNETKEEENDINKDENKEDEES